MSSPAGVRRRGLGLRVGQLLTTAQVLFDALWGSPSPKCLGGTRSRIRRMCPPVSFKCALGIENFQEASEVLRMGHLVREDVGKGDLLRWKARCRLLFVGPAGPPLRSTCTSLFCALGRLQAVLLLGSPSHAGSWTFACFSCKYGPTTYCIK